MLVVEQKQKEAKPSEKGIEELKREAKAIEDSLTDAKTTDPDIGSGALQTSVALLRCAILCHGSIELANLDYFAKLFSDDKNDDKFPEKKETAQLLTDLEKSLSGEQKISLGKIFSDKIKPQEVKSLSLGKTSKDALPFLTVIACRIAYLIINIRAESVSSWGTTVSEINWGKGLLASEGIMVRSLEAMISNLIIEDEKSRIYAGLLAAITRQYAKRIGLKKIPGYNDQIQGFYEKLSSKAAEIEAKIKVYDARKKAAVIAEVKPPVPVTKSVTSVGEEPKASASIPTPAVFEEKKLSPPKQEGMPQV